MLDAKLSPDNYIIFAQKSSSLFSKIESFLTINNLELVQGGILTSQLYIKIDRGYFYQ